MALNINNVSGGVVNVGNALYLAPKNASYTNTGAGSLNTGDHIRTSTLWSINTQQDTKSANKDR